MSDVEQLSPRREEADGAEGTYESLDVTARNNPNDDDDDGIQGSEVENSASTEFETQPAVSLAIDSNAINDHEKPVPQPRTTSAKSTTSLSDQRERKHRPSTGSRVGFRTGTLNPPITNGADEEEPITGITGSSLKPALSQADDREDGMVDCVSDVEADLDGGESAHGGREDVLSGSMSDIDNTPGLRGKANTPASFFTADFNEFRTPNPPETREAMFQQAMSLMTERCPSMALMRRECDPRTPLSGSNDPPYGPHAPRYFYIHQMRPSPMPPLQAWRGYHGNVYFEPIKVNTMRMAQTDTDRSATSLESPSQHLERLQQGFPPSKRTSVRTLTTGRSQTAAADGRSPVSGSTRRPVTRNAKSSTSTRSGPSRQMVILDKKAVFNRNNDKIHEDIVWVVGQESTGSLCVAPGTRAQSSTTTTVTETKPAATKTKKTFDKEKICRGSVAHKIYAMKNKHMPLLSVSGDKYTSPQLPSPLLRTQTQYSHSHQRALINSPDLYHTNFSGSLDRLPPLEQLRASLKQIDHPSSGAGNGHVLHVITPLERMKFQGEDAKGQPLVRYSTELTHPSGKIQSRIK